jgi:hypothetical protein
MFNLQAQMFNFTMLLLEFCIHFFNELSISLLIFVIEVKINEFVIIKNNPKLSVVGDGDF